MRKRKKVQRDEEKDEGLKRKVKEGKGKRGRKGEKNRRDGRGR